MHHESAITIPSLPETVEAFVALRDELARTPHGGAAMFVVAIEAFTRGADLGLACFTIAIDASELVAGDVYKGRAPRRMTIDDLRQRIGAKPYVARSYFAGTSPEEAYRLPDGPLQVRIRHQERDPLGPERAKLFVHSTGADSPRPIVLVRNDRGLWKAKSWSSLEVGVRPPVEVVVDDL
ncbi:MAG: hypothetical protein KC619_05770 [Myxococcales bacterium]|nr:hypothetical protein [Myxococcales bacterium]